MGFSWSFFLVQHLHTQIALGALGKDENGLFLGGAGLLLPLQMMTCVSCHTATISIACVQVVIGAKLPRRQWPRVFLPLVSSCMSMLRPARCLTPWVASLMGRRVL